MNSSSSILKFNLDIALQRAGLIQKGIGKGNEGNTPPEQWDSDYGFPPSATG